MKRYVVLALFLFIVVSGAYAADAPATKLFFRDTDGSEHVAGASQPFPVTGTVGAFSAALPTGTNTIGSVKSVPVTSASATTLAVTPVAAAITALTGRIDVSIFNIGTETAWLQVGTTTAVVSSCIPIYSGGFFSREVSSSVALGVISSSPTTIVVHQGGF